MKGMDIFLGRLEKSTKMIASALEEIKATEKRIDAKILRFEREEERLLQVQKETEYAMSDLRTLCHSVAGDTNRMIDDAADELVKEAHHVYMGDHVYLDELSEDPTLA